MHTLDEMTARVRTLRRGDTHVYGMSVGAERTVGAGCAVTVILVHICIPVVVVVGVCLYVFIEGSVAAKSEMRCPPVADCVLDCVGCLRKVDATSLSSAVLAINVARFSSRALITVTNGPSAQLPNCRNPTRYPLLVRTKQDSIR